MKKTAFEKIQAGLVEALSVAKGDAEPARMHVAPEIDVRAIRQKTELTQDSFASTFGFNVDQVKNWEQGRSRPLGGARAYLLLINRYPEEIKKLRLELASTETEQEYDEVRCG
ncbi:helix-turn-helix domain-containing protein [Acetobacter senegalensis]|uniref:Helix-turn-helix domain-containing protein n=1 Tax=Acetobacter senegalensis TaxID=446692 RepID=A0A0U5EU92_9PROT|nr:hypothetical protein [Acetobacter senegalensis]CEF41275.1 helix-turn-helix domain-containing protein [Acetobacter senegalensis]